MRYYYSLNNQPLGPVPIEQLHDLYRAGTITLETLIAAEGATEWKPYSTLNPAPLDVASTSTAPPLAPETPTTAATLPSPSAVPPASSAASAGSTVPPTPAASTPWTPPSVPAPGYKNLVLISWILLGGCALLSVIPVIGCLSWVMFIPIFITTIVLGIITLSRGGTRDGVLILVASVVILPAFTLIAPILTTALLGKVTEAGDKAKPRSSRITSASPAATATPRIAPASTIPPAATRPPAAPEMPNAAAAKSMVNNTMLNFKNAINSADFEAFYRTQLSDLWKAETTPEQLEKTFKPFIDKKVDLSPIFFVEPVIEPAPYMDNNGMLVLKGHYPLQKEKVNVTYELTYSREAKWGLSGINVRTKPLSQ